jgi:hypothetical protein
MFMDFCEYREEENVEEYLPMVGNMDREQVQRYL